MPLGAFRLNGISRYVAPAGAPPIDEVFSLSNLTYNARSFQIPKISYVGDDSSGQPVFFVGTRSSAGDFVCSLIRRNNNGTITESSVTTLKNTDERFEAQGVAGFDTSGNPVGVTVGCYRVAGVIRMVTFANQIDLDNLTLGTTYSLDNWSNTQPNAGFSYVTYVGNGRFLTGYRNTGIRVCLQTVGTSSITDGNEQQHAAFGDGVYQGINAFPYQNDTDYRYAAHNGNGNQQGVGWFATGTAQGIDTDDIITVGLQRTQALPITDNDYITVATTTGNARATAATVTWPASGAPTQTVGSETTLSNSATWSGSFCAAANLTTNTLYVLHNDSTNGWRILPLTASGTTISEGSFITFSASTANWGSGNESNAACFAESAQGNLFVAMIDDTSSNNPKIFFKEIV